MFKSEIFVFVFDMLLRILGVANRKLGSMCAIESSFPPNVRTDDLRLGLLTVFACLSSEVVRSKSSASSKSESSQSTS